MRPTDPRHPAPGPRPSRRRRRLEHRSPRGPKTGPGTETAPRTKTGPSIQNGPWTQTAPKIAPTSLRPGPRSLAAAAVALLVLPVLLAALPGVAAASPGLAGPGGPSGPAGTGAAGSVPPLVEGDGVVVDRVEVRVEVVDAVASTELTLVLRNVANASRQAHVRLPLTPGATLTAFNLTFGDRRFEGVVLEKQAAEAAYHDSVERGDDAVLLEAVGEEAVRLRVHAGPGEERVLRLRTVDHLPLTQGARSWRLPASLIQAAAAGPQPERGAAGDGSDPAGNGSSAAGDGSVPAGDGGDAQNAPGGPAPAPAPAPLHVQVDVHTSNGITGHAAPARPFDRVDVAGQKLHAEVELADPSAGADDLVLTWTEGGGVWVPSLVAAAPPGGDAAAAVPVMATVSMRPHDVGDALPRDMVFVLDTSGSMSGHKIVQARESIREVLLTLRPDDRYAVVLFDSDVTVLTEGLVDVSSSTVSRTRDRLATVRADGSTNLDGGLQRALDLLGTQGEAGRVPLVVLVTDGRPTAGVTDPSAIVDRMVQANRREAAVHPIAIGLDADDSFLADLAARSGGTLTELDPGAALQAELGSFYASLGDPILTDVEVDVRGVEHGVVLPRVLPPLYRDDTLTVLFRANLSQVSAGSGVTLTLSGTGTTGPVTASFPFPLAQVPVVGEVRNLWGQALVADLLGRERVNGTSPGLRHAIVQSAVHYGVVTPYTSWVVVEVVEPVDADVDADGNATDPDRNGTDLPGHGALPHPVRRVDGRILGLGAPGGVAFDEALHHLAMDPQSATGSGAGAAGGGANASWATPVSVPGPTRGSGDAGSPSAQRPAHDVGHPVIPGFDAAALVAALAAGAVVAGRWRRRPGCGKSDGKSGGGRGRQSGDGSSGESGRRGPGDR